MEEILQKKISSLNKEHLFFDKTRAFLQWKIAGPTKKTAPW